MTIEPVAYFRSPFRSKFGIPRQSGLVDGVCGQIVLEPRYACADAVRGLEDFDYLWIIWGFSANADAEKRLTVRPPRLGGNRRLGVFATRSPFRPNNIGLSSVRIGRVEADGDGKVIIHVSGADLMDGTPVYDIKPYVAFTDSHAAARSGFVDTEPWHRLTVDLPDNAAACMPGAVADTLMSVLEQDPRPQYHDDPERVYGMPFGEWDVRFKVSGDVLKVVEIVKL